MASRIYLRRSLTALILAGGAVGALGGCSDSTAASASDSSASAPAPSSSADAMTPYMYSGRDGSTALELLLELDPTAQATGSGESAMVTTVQGRTADDGAKEFWALYVNGNSASVGAGSLQTTDADVIEWRLESFA